MTSSSEQELVFNGALPTEDEIFSETVSIEPRTRSQDRYVFRNLKNFIVSKSRSFAVAAVKCFRRYTNFKAFVPNASRKLATTWRFIKENCNPLVFVSRLGEFWQDFTKWARDKHRFPCALIWSFIFGLSVLIIAATYKPGYIDNVSGQYVPISFLAAKAMPFWTCFGLAMFCFIQTAFGFNNIYKRLINLTRKYPITVAVVMGVIAVAVPVLIAASAADFMKAIMVPAIVSLLLLLFFYSDLFVGLISRFLFRKSDDGSNTLVANLKGYLYLAPAVVPLLVFTFYPMLNAIFMGFVKFDNNFIYTSWSFSNFVSKVFTSSEFRSNNLTLLWFQKTLTDPQFYHSLITTIIIVLVTVPISTGISVLLAVMMNSIKRLQSVYQTIYFLPYVTAMTAVTSVWRLFLSESGLINTIFGSSLNWLTSADPLFRIGPKDFIGIKGGSGFYSYNSWTYPVYPQLFGFIIYSIWDGLAFKIVIFLTGLQSIDKQVYQAAQLDGASRSRTFFKITLPLLAPIMLFITTTSMIGAFKTYTSTKSLFLNNPRFQTIVFYMFQYIDGTKTFYDRASAVADLLFIIIMSFTGIRMMLKSRKAKKDAPTKAKKVKGKQRVRRADRILAAGGNN